MNEYYQPNKSDPFDNPKRPIVRALLRGAGTRCPNCGKGHLFLGYLKTASQCNKCAEPLFHHQADDAPSYFTVLIIGHIIIPLVLLIEVAYHPPLWIHATIWLPLTTAAALLTLRPVKGALVALQWALYMHGFDPQERIDSGHVGSSRSTK